MACETPVVGSMVGGIPEVIVHDETGLLVPLAQQKETPFNPLHPSAYASDLAHQINRLMEDPAMRQKFAQAGRKRAIELFSWQSIAEQIRSASSIFDRLQTCKLYGKYTFFIQAHENSTRRH